MKIVGISGSSRTILVLMDVLLEWSFIATSQT